MRREFRRRTVLLLSMGALIGYGALLVARRSAGAGGSDGAGYANTARDIAARQIVVPIEALARLGLEQRLAPAFIPLAHEPGPRPGTMVPFYPPGFPLHLAFAALLAGWKAAPFLVSPIAAILCLALTYLLARELGLSRPFASTGAAMLGGSTIFLFQAIQPMSDVAAALWAVAAIVAALRSRRSTGWAVAAGAAFGIGVLVRPTNGLLLLPLVLALPLRGRAFGLFVTGGLPFAGFYALWNRAAFGSPWRTGYSHLFGGEFSLSNFGPRLTRYGTWVLAQLSPLVPAGWFGVFADRRVPGRDRAMLALWFGSLFLFYCFWGPSDSWTYARYLLPAAPALIVGFLLGLRDALRRVPGGDAEGPARLPRPRTLAAAVVLGVVALFEWRVARRIHPLRSVRWQVVYPEACRAVAAKAGGEKALVVSMDFSAALRFYTDLTPLRWDVIEPRDFELVRARAAEKGDRIFAVLLPYEVERAMARVPGPWSFLGKVREAGLWELPPGP